MTDSQTKPVAPLSDEALFDFEMRPSRFRRLENRHEVGLTPDERDALCQSLRAAWEMNKCLAKDNVRVANESHKASDRWQAELQQTERQLKAITEDRNLLYTQNAALREQLVHERQRYAALEQINNAAERERQEAESRLAQVEKERDSCRNEIDAAWLAIHHGWDIEPRSYFEREAPLNGFESPLAQAVHHMWKRKIKIGDTE